MIVPTASKLTGGQEPFLMLSAQQKDANVLAVAVQSAVSPKMATLAWKQDRE